MNLPSELDLARSLLRISKDSYTLSTHKIREAECYLTEYSASQIVAFRGTEFDKFLSGSGWRDVLRDLRIMPWYDKRVGWCHAGFLKGAKAVVDTFLVKELDKSRPVYLTGHSLGGALAIIAAKLLHAEGFNIRAVRTFGAPRALHFRSSKQYKTTGIDTVEYSNLGDPIPDIPFRFWGYRHVNEVITDRKRKGYGILRNHLLDHYMEAFNVQA